MDHAINALMPFFEVELDFVREEWETGRYRKLTDCPSYHAAKALIDAIHRLEKCYYGESKTISIRDYVRWCK